MAGGKTDDITNGELNIKEYSMWTNADVQSRFLTLIGSSNLNSLNVPLPADVDSWTDDELRQFLYSPSDMEQYIYEHYQQAFETLENEIETDKAIQDEYLEKLKKRYDQELIPLAEGLNIDTNVYNENIQDLRKLQDVLNSKNLMLSRDRIELGLNKELDEQQKATSEVVDVAISQDGEINKEELENLAADYIAKRTTWHVIKEKLDSL